MAFHPGKIAAATALTLSCITLIGNQLLLAKDSSKSSDKPVPAKTAYSGPPVLDPTQFFGEAAMGYASAKACPEVIAKLFCYCGCDLSDSHSSLLDCYTGLHGTDCHICQEEAVMALRMTRNGASIAEIQKAVDETYAGKYPFQEESAALKKYKTSRLWKTEASGANDKKSATPTAPNKNNDEKAGATQKPKVKAGFHPGNCCHKDHTK